MAQAASVVVNDRAATPVAHTFAPRDITTDLASFVESASVPIGERKITVSKRKTGTRYKIRLLLTSPTLVTEVVNGVNVPKVTRTAFGDVTFTFEDTSSQQERKDTVGMVANALASTQAMLNSTLVDLEGIW